MDHVTKCRRSAKCRFTRKYNDYMQYVRDCEAFPVMSIKYDEVKEAWVNLERTHNDYMVNTDDSDGPNGEEWMDDPQQKYNEVVKSYVRLKRTAVVDPVVDGIDTKSKSVPSLHLETTKLPRFSGNLRDYAHFKSDFQRYVEPNVPGDMVAYTLKSCLSDEAAHKVRNEDSVGLMWSVLDEKYADPATVVDVIMDDIRRTHAFRNDETSRFINFVDKIEDGYSDLCKLGLQKELTTTSSVSIVEQKLSPDMKTRWARIVTCKNSVVDRADKFTSILDFLKDEKRAIEYQCAALRMNGSDSTEGTTHSVHLAEVSDVWRQRTPYDRSSRCLLHADSAHQTEDCVEYLFKSVDQRLALLRHKRACWLCLNVGHQARTCDVQWFCGENGCTRRHHRTLHITEIYVNVGRTNHVLGQETHSVIEKCDVNTNSLMTDRRQTTLLLESNTRITHLEKKLKEQERTHKSQLELLQKEIQSLKTESSSNMSRQDNNDMRCHVTEEAENHGVVSQHGVVTQQAANKPGTAPMYTPRTSPRMYPLFMCTCVLVTLVGVANATQYNAWNE